MREGLELYLDKCSEQSLTADDATYGVSRAYLHDMISLEVNTGVALPLHGEVTREHGPWVYFIRAAFYILNPTRILIRVDLTRQVGNSQARYTRPS